MILYSDDDLVVINKPPGISVHDAPGPGGSVLRELRERHGLNGLTPVHRLDKDASGVLVLARSKESAARLQERWAEVEKVYTALCEGAPVGDRSTIDAPILENQTGKPERLERALRYFAKTHPGEALPPLPKSKTSAVHPAGRASQTDIRVLARSELAGRTWSWLEARPKQGRMHQIRVHLKHAGCALACDPLYGNRATLLARDLEAPLGDAVLLARMPLHASRLRIPYGGALRDFEAPIPADIQKVLQRLRLLQ